MQISGCATGNLLLDLRLYDVIHTTFHNLLGTIKEEHDANVIAAIENIMVMTINESDAHFQPLLQMLLAVSNREQKASKVACNLVNTVLKQCEAKIERYQQQRAKEELNARELQIVGFQEMSKNQMRKEKICFTCRHFWSLGHTCEGNKEEESAQEVQIDIEEVEDLLVRLQHNEDHEREPPMDDGKDCYSILFGELEVLIDFMRMSINMICLKMKIDLSMIMDYLKTTV